MAGSSLTAAQIVPGIGGLGTGIVNVTGAGSSHQPDRRRCIKASTSAAGVLALVTVSSGGGSSATSPLHVLQRHRKSVRVERHAEHSAARSAASARSRSDAALCRPGSATAGAARRARFRSRTAGTLSTTGNNSSRTTMA
jgi:hypothetical protein